MLEQNNDVFIVIVVVSLTLIVFVVVFLFLLISNTNRKNRHRAELSELNLSIAQEVAEAEHEAVQQTLSAVGRELHDNVSQLLTAANLNLQHRFPELSDDEQLQEIRAMISESREEVVRLGRSLNMDHWNERPLFESIEQSLTRIEGIQGLKIHVDKDEEPTELKAEKKVLLFRCFQEILNNSLKYAKAQHFEVELRSTPLFLRFKDDGVGFDLSSKSSGSGLKNIMHRCQIIGLEATVISSNGQGCTWQIQEQ